MRQSFSALQSTVAIATGTAAVGILGVTALFVEGASERAFSLHRRF